MDGKTVEQRQRLHISSIKFILNKCTVLHSHHVVCIREEFTSQSILSTLEKHKIDIKSCWGQAYETISSMSSSNVGVQAHMKKVAHDADYLDCCLQNLNLVICKSSIITAITEMFDSCQQAYLSCHKSPKRQKFLEQVIDCICPTAKNRKINGLCQTKSVEKHTIFDIILKMYSYLIQSWTEIWHPSNCEQLFADEKCIWDTETRCAANGLRHTFGCFGHIVVIMRAKQVLELIYSIAKCLQGRLQEVSFGYQRIDETIKCY